MIKTNLLFNLNIKKVTWLYPGVTVDLVQRHRVTVVLCFSPPSHNDHSIFNQSSSMEETGQGLHSKETMSLTKKKLILYISYD